MTTIALVGDSHMGSSGLGPKLAAMLEGLGLDVVRRTANDGKGTSWYVSSGALHQATLGVDLAIVELGGNDLQGDTSKAAYQQLLVNARQQIAAPLVLWVGPSSVADTAEGDVDFRHERAASYQRAIAPRIAGVTWFDSRPFTEEGHRDDGVHFTQAGYERWARAIANAAAWLATPPLVRAVMFFGSFPLFAAVRGI